MYRPISFPWIATFITLIALANGIAYWQHLYFYFPKLDIPMHFAGGAWISLFVFWFAAQNGRYARITHDRFLVFLAGFVVTLAIGILWELFEFSLERFISYAPHDIDDTLGDLFFDMLGSLCASLLVLVARYTTSHD